jgi:hypothetical protein
MVALMVMEVAKRWIKCSNLEKEEREKKIGSRHRYI